MMGVDEQHEFVEVDPTGRYGRYNEILGKGASKLVYRGFDELEGIEVAWNQVKLHDFLQSPEDLERLYCEIHLLKTLKHKNIMKFYCSWVDTSKRNINFVTEMFTSGTLRQYRQKHRRVNIRAVKHWSRQILSGLLYLHSHDPPIIHRDLKCDNIFVNGNQGEVKIGDLGLAAILRKSHAVHCVGTPEFMAPEVYQEEYNELVDIYSFGMCVLEMVTFEYPYIECTHPAEIYKKVITGTKPEALYRVKDPEVRRFVEKCLATASRRLSARELLTDPFLQLDDFGSGALEDMCSMGLIFGQPTLHHYHSNGSLISNGFSSNFDHDSELVNSWGYDNAYLEEAHGMDLFKGHDDEYLANIDITIKGRRREDGSIFLRLRIADKDGRVRNIYFPFDIEADTALSVATEMVAELDITDYEVTRIADMIDGEVVMLEPDWRPGPGIEDMEGVPKGDVCHVCASNVSSCDSVLDYISKINPSTGLQSVHCQCAEVHGRFEEITFQIEESDQCVTHGAPLLSTSQFDGLEISSQSRDHGSDEERKLLQSSYKDEQATPINGYSRSESRKSQDDLLSSSHRQQCLETPQGYQFSGPIISDDDAKGLQLERRWPDADNQMELEEDSNQQLAGSRRVYHPSLDISNKGFILEKGASGSTVFKPLKTRHRRLESFHLGTHNSFRIPESDGNLLSPTIRVHADEDSRHCWISCPDFQCQSGENYEADASCGSRIMLTAEKFYARTLLPVTLPRTKSLPVDPVDV